jgi:hypothetical protein
MEWAYLFVGLWLFYVPLYYAGSYWQYLSQITRRKTKITDTILRIILIFNALYLNSSSLYLFMSLAVCFHSVLPVLTLDLTVRWPVDILAMYALFDWLDRPTRVSIDWLLHWIYVVMFKECSSLEYSIGSSVRQCTHSAQCQMWVSTILIWVASVSRMCISCSQ